MDFLYTKEVTVPAKYAKYAHLRGQVPRELEQFWVDSDDNNSNANSDEEFLSFLDDWYRHKNSIFWNFNVQRTKVSYMRSVDADPNNSRPDTAVLYLNGFSKYQYFDPSHPIYIKGFINPANYTWAFQPVHPCLKTNGVTVCGALNRSDKDYGVFKHSQRYTASIGANFNYAQWCRAFDAQIPLEGYRVSLNDDNAVNAMMA